ncbi:hypothetical protein BKA69DRAFT_1040745 [Paraphysoderma sedebokerense]|nr:hypothetical protein BKA69DRAFT_1040745 [Paraphysoderma sedebokerense]
MWLSSTESEDSSDEFPEFSGAQRDDVGYFLWDFEVRTDSGGITEGEDKQFLSIVLRHTSKVCRQFKVYRSGNYFREGTYRAFSIESNVIVLNEVRTDLLQRKRIVLVEGLCYNDEFMLPLIDSAADANNDGVSARSSNPQNSRTSTGKRKRNDINLDNGKKLKSEDTEDLKSEEAEDLRSEDTEDLESEEAEDDTDDWSREETLDLIDCIGEIYESWQSEKRPTKRGKLWKKAFTEFNTKHPKRAIDAFKMKWERLVATYDEVVLHNRQSSVAPISWEYQSHMFDILKNDPSHHPTITSDTLCCAEEERKRSKDGFSRIVEITQDFQKKNHEFVEYQKKQQEEQDRRWGKFMENTIKMNNERNDLLRSIAASLTQR